MPTNLLLLHLVKGFKDVGYISSAARNLAVEGDVREVVDKVDIRTFGFVHIPQGLKLVCSDIDGFHIVDVALYEGSHGRELVDDNRTAVTDIHGVLVGGDHHYVAQRDVVCGDEGHPVGGVEVLEEADLVYRAVDLVGPWHGVAQIDANQREGDVGLVVGGQQVLLASDEHGAGIDFVAVLEGDVHVAQGRTEDRRVAVGVELVTFVGVGGVAGVEVDVSYYVCFNQFVDV